VRHDIEAALNDLQLLLHEYAGGEYQTGTLDQDRLGIST